MKLSRVAGETKISKRKVFRACEDDIERLLNPGAWPDSIVISEWFFSQLETTRTLMTRDVVLAVMKVSDAQRQPKQISTQCQGQSSSGGVNGRKGTDVEVDHGSTTVCQQ